MAEMFEKKPLVKGLGGRCTFDLRNLGYWVLSVVMSSRQRRLLAIKHRKEERVCAALEMVRYLGVSLKRCISPTLNSPCIFICEHFTRWAPVLSSSFITDLHKRADGVGMKMTVQGFDVEEPKKSQRRENTPCTAIVSLFENHSIPSPWALYVCPASIDQRRTDEKKVDSLLTVERRLTEILE